MTDEQIKKAAAGFSWVNLNCDENRNNFARAIEAAATAPLLERIAALEAKLSYRVTDTPIKLSECQFLETPSAAAPAAPEQREPMISCRCFDEAARKYCTNKNRCSMIVAQAPNAQQAEAQEPCAWRFRLLYGTDGMEKRSGDWRHVGYLPQPGKDVVIEPLFTLPQPAQLQALSESELQNIWQGMKQGDVFSVLIQSELAAKNGAVLT